MKWMPATGSTQQSSDGRYLIMEATSKHWIAYALSERSDIGTLPSAEDARAVCDSHSRASLTVSPSSPSPP